MIKIDNNLLIEIGLGDLPVAEKNQLLAQIYDTLEMRVGMRLAEQMTDEQLTEFESYMDAEDQEGALTWLETNFPNYRQVVADELETLKAEIRGQADAIRAAVDEQSQPGQHGGEVPPAQ